MAALLAFEIKEGLRYLNEPDFYHVSEECDPENGKIWLGAAEDTVFRKRGVEFVDGSAPGFAAIVGAAPTPEIAKEIIEEYQKRSILSSWPPTRTAPVCRAAGGSRRSGGLEHQDRALRPGHLFGHFRPRVCQPGRHGFRRDSAGRLQKMLMYNKNRIFAFVNALGDVGAEWGAAAAGCVNWGFPTLADTDIPEILPTGVCTYEHVIANVPHDEMVQKSVETRGLKVTISDIDIPCNFGPAYEGERVRGADLYTQMGGGKTQATELVKLAEMNEIEDGKVNVIGPDIGDIKEGDVLPLGIYVQVAGREMQVDFEPILERQIHHLINYIQGVMHMGQRDIAWVRVSKAAVEKGFTLKISVSCCMPSSTRISVPSWTRSK
jgi:acetyl-CoA synthase